MPALVKICGMKTPENITQIAGLKPDYLGFIFYSGSSRYVGPDWFGADFVDNKIGKVGVFVDEKLENILDLAIKFGLDVIQLHGQESPHLASELKKKGYKVWKAFALESAESIEATKDYIQSCEYFLFDTPGKLPGGNGLAFDWQLLSHYQGPVGFWLSGGLDADLAKFALQNPHPYMIGLDFNSRLETAPAHKDATKVALAVETVRKS